LAQAHFRAFPNGIRIAATSSFPLSVTNMLYIAAAFLVSVISILIPISLMAFLVAGARN
jgi:hypothetical protein